MIKKKFYSFLLLRLPLKNKVLRSYFLLLSLLLLSISVSAQNNGIISKFKDLSMQQLLDTGDYYYYQSCFDTALICYSLIINTPGKDNDFEQQKKVIEALNKSGVIYRLVSDYRQSYERFITGLDLCEKYQHDDYKSKFYVNIGDIYYSFKKYDISKSYSLQALSSCRDSAIMIIILNNLGMIEMENENFDAAFHFLEQSLEISKKHQDRHLYDLYNSYALLYQKTEQYDSAFHYFRLSLDEVKKHNQIRSETENLSQLGNLFFKINRIDSALHYIRLSNEIATGNNLLEVLVENYLTKSQIEEAKGNTKKAFEYYKTYAHLKDSIFNVDKFGEINQLQRLYEVTKTNQQIEQLSIEQHIKERTIRYQRIIQMITWAVLLLVSVVLVFIYFQNRRLNAAYKVLFKKNLEIINLDSLETNQEKYKRRVLSVEIQHELLEKILSIMDDSSLICDAGFTLDKLAEMVQSNHSYVSQVINTAFQKNFRAFVNEYRIREAQRLFSEQDVAKYTIEFVALQVGFKSRSNFYEVFKEITGISPSFYLKSLKEQRLL